MNGATVTCVVMSTVTCCRFHLGQIWFRKIQKVGLTTEYIDTGSEIGQWLSNFFRLSFFQPDDVVECFVEDLIVVAPSDSRCVAFADYVLDNYTKLLPMMQSFIQVYGQKNRQRDEE